MHFTWSERNRMNSDTMLTFIDKCRQSQERDRYDLCLELLNLVYTDKASLLAELSALWREQEAALTKGVS